MTRRKIAAGNWKMNGTVTSLAELDALMTGVGQPDCDVLICPPFTLLAGFAGVARTSIVRVGAQDCHPAENGAHTGDVSAEMIRDTGAVAVIVGHSERRADHGESSDLVRAKAQAAWRAGLVAVICVGETEAERDGGQALDVVLGQLDASIPFGASPQNTVIAYEPVWAIGTGRTPSLDDIDEMHGAIRERLVQRHSGEAIRVLYGGSVKPDNAGEIFAVDNVDGGLVGGASLKAADFLQIIAAASAA